MDPESAPSLSGLFSTVETSIPRPSASEKKSSRPPQSYGAEEIPTSELRNGIKAGFQYPL